MLKNFRTGHSRSDIDAHMADVYQQILVGNYDSGGHSEGSGVALTVNRLYAIPFFVARTRTYDRIAVEVTSGTAGNMRLGVYEDNGSVNPGALKLDAGVVETTAVETDTITISLQLTKGLWWMAGVLNATPSLTKVQESLSYFPLGLNSIFAQQVAGFRAFTYAALPDPFGGALTFVGLGSATPLIAMRVLTND